MSKFSHEQGLGDMGFSPEEAAELLTSLGGTVEIHVRPYDRQTTAGHFVMTS